MTLFGSQLPLLLIGVSLLTAMLIFVVGEQRQKTRIVLNLGAAVVKLALVLVLLRAVEQGQTFLWRMPLLPGLDLVLKVDSLSLLFATLSALLWLLTTIYAIGYLERSPHRARFFGFFSLCVASTMGIAMAGNLFTFFVFYELLTLATWPLLVHRGSAESLAAGRSYLRHTLFGSSLFLIGLIWLMSLTGPQDFIAGGQLATDLVEQRHALQAIFVLMVAGLGVKAALVPLHGWLPQAMVAPAPVSALLHAVAVVKAGAFAIVRLIHDVFGHQQVQQLGLADPLVVAACVTIIYGSLMALKQTDLKRRLAYSTVSQVSYITLGAAIGGPLATIGGLVHLVHQGLMKITLFFCAGSFAELRGVKAINQLDGIGRAMPLTSAAFTLAALGMIGLPPLAGFISKWYLGAGALQAGQGWVVAVLIVSTLLNAMYFLPLMGRIWFRPPPEHWPPHQTMSRLATLALVVPALLSGLAALGAGLFAGLNWSPLNWVRLIVAREYP